jgi:3-methyl-2-oxobutanoate hydroxymethyltransferase
MKPGKLTLHALADLKSKGEKIVMVTAYDAPGARLAEEAGIDILLVGDTAGMVVLGHDGTVPVTMEEMLFLTRSVSGAVQRPLVVGDMPFGSYHVSDEDAVRNAIRFVKEADADVVKLEGAGVSLSRVKAIVSAGIGVMGHIGLTPQSETMLGGFKTQGRTAAAARQLLADALALEAAGCFAIVLEAVPVPVAARITESVTVPTIGIGAGPACDGQVLVYHDLLGLTEGRAPRFVKRYANLAEEIRGALGTYAADVRSGAYPAPEHTYAMPEDELELFSEAFRSDESASDRSFPTDARAEPARPKGGTASGASAQRVEQRHDNS